MSQPVITVHPEDSLRSAMGVLLAHQISGAPVMAEGRVVGVLSATDILDFAASPPPEPARREGHRWEDWAMSAPDWDLLAEFVVADAMTASVLSLPSTAALDEAAALMIRTRAHRLLVVDGERLRGVISSMDVVRAVAERTL
jgi:CBS domain-containing protein